jgi:hypothetical protein
MKLLECRLLGKRSDDYRHRKISEHHPSMENQTPPQEKNNYKTTQN